MARGTSPFEIAESLGTGVAEVAIVAKVKGELYDLDPATRCRRASRATFRRAATRPLDRREPEIRPDIACNMTAADAKSRDAKEHPSAHHDTKRIDMRGDAMPFEP